MDGKKIEEKIRKKAEKIPVPDTLQPDYVEEKIKNKRQASRFPWKTTAWAAAACLALVVCSALFMQQGAGEKVKTVEPAEAGRTEKIETARSEQGADKQERVMRKGTDYAVLCNAVNAYNDREKERYALESEAVRSDMQKSTNADMATGAASSSASGFSDTDMQVEGIEEGDIVKTDGKHIYVAQSLSSGSKIKIYKASQKKATAVSDFKIKDLTVDEMYVYGEKLIVIASRWEAQKIGSGAWTEDCVAVPGKSEVRSFVYDISDAKNPSRIASHKQSGAFNTSRFTNGYLYVFSSHSVWGDGHKDRKPETFVPKADGKVLKEEDIVSVTGRENNRYMVMTSLSINKPEKFSDTFAAFGGSDVYYMNEKHIYATEAYYREADSDKEKDSDSELHTQIVKFGYMDGIFEKQASAKVKGLIENSYYMHEYKGNFCYVYTRFKKDTTVNGLCVLDDKLKVLGELTGLGKGETIYSSYYMDNMAYFVTYRNTDPVFAVDLSNPKKPELKSELKIPGFSNYLHSFGDGMLIGVGQGEGKQKDGFTYQALKLSLFEYDSRYEIKEKTVFLGEKRTDSLAGENHKAVFVDEERGLVGLGVINYENGQNSYQMFQFNGKKWKLVMKKDNMTDIYNTRGLRIGNSFYVVDIKKGISVYDMNSWEKLG